MAGSAIIEDMESITDVSVFERLLREPHAIVLKHSTQCGISARAHREAERFLAAHPERSIHKVEVLESREVSDFIETRTGIRHESPQVLVFEDGEVVWHGSHGRVTADAIAAALR